MNDTILRDGAENEVELLSPCALLGERTHLRVKCSCNDHSMLPVYRCPVKRLVSPFGETADLTSCPCDKYQKAC